MPQLAVHASSCNPKGRSRQQEMVAKDGRTQAILGGAGHASYLALIGGVSMPIWLSGLVNCDCCVVRRDPTPPFNRQPSPTTLDVDLTTHSYPPSWPTQGGFSWGFIFGDGCQCIAAYAERLLNGMIKRDQNPEEVWLTLVFPFVGSLSSSLATPTLPNECVQTLLLEHDGRLEPDVETITAAADASLFPLEEAFGAGGTPPPTLPLVSLVSVTGLRRVAPWVESRGVLFAERAEIAMGAPKVLGTAAGACDDEPGAS